jgi:ribosome-associated heat shock protein Hsp15
MLKVNDTEIDKELDAIFTSHEFNEPKESQLFWSKLAHQIAFDPKRTLFIDDSIRILEAAKKFGIKSILGINKPDSTKNVNLISGFDSISYFDEILPIIQKEECKKKIRIDKWLWAARFFKTRNLSKAAITAGKVQIDGNKVKVSKDLALGTILSIKQGMDEKIVIVKNLCGKRGSATRAQQMYTETEESICTRARNDASKKVFYNNFLKSKRPTKKERRQIHKFSKKNIYDL